MGRPRAVQRFEWQESVDEVSAYTDSDWAGCRQSGRSTSGGVLTRGRHLLKSWSATQKNVTLSSGEAELVAAVRGATEGIGMTRLGDDWGLELSCAVIVDSTAAIGTMSRRGSGRLRHVRIGHLWVQERVESGELRLEKVRTDRNPADILTKFVGGEKMAEHMRQLSYEYRVGRADAALELST